MKRILGVLILLASTSLSLAYAQDSKPQTAPNTNEPGSGLIYVGKYYQGGVIYWLDPEKSNQHGLIADISDADTGQVSSFAWDTSPPSKTKATDDEPYSGKENTQIILKAIGASRALAANACQTSTKQGFTDWYLPAKKELVLLFGTTAVSKTAKANGGTGFSDSPYWSSTEYFANSAWNVSRSGGTHGASTYKKNIPLHVRCVRAF